MDSLPYLSVILPDAIDVLLQKTCRHCGKALILHAAARVVTRSAKSWTSSVTMALELLCPYPGGFQHCIMATELRMRLVDTVDLLPPINPRRPKRAKESGAKGKP